MTRRGLLLALPVFVLAVTLADARPADENPIVTLVKSKVKDKSKPFATTVTFKVKGGQEKAFEEAFKPVLAATRKEPGCLAYELNRDAEEPATYLMYEKFRSIAALEEHAKSKYVEELLGKIGPMLDGEPKVRVYSVPE